MTSDGLRAMSPDDHAPLLRLWHDAWHEAHAAHVPAALTALRTPEDFDLRLAGMTERLRMVGPPGAPLGFCAIKGDEIDQLFVARAARGTGVAARLLADGEARLARAGVATGVLDCVIENTRAIRFYTRNGWHPRGEEDVTLDTAGGLFVLRALVMTKPMDQAGHRFTMR